MQKALTDGNTEGGLDINAPRQSDGVRRAWIGSPEAYIERAQGKSLLHNYVLKRGAIDPKPMQSLKRL